ncbi:L-2-hydroxyglutarate dehydrogenase, mitochondrial [Nilaparvata lugens]|uniref:L-2-hydroxyglutarate dehydrogenase, mitochondrial n=1 Tax=Nilaparvata lugens TaxID=108931 RepID=UPI00193E7F6F|nr:L-2-hydroxyglutarate dehydrogenase, mitochondrial [Nilaparvata lugens]
MPYISKVFLQTSFIYSSRTRMKPHFRTIRASTGSDSSIHLKLMSTATSSGVRNEECFDLTIIGGGIVGMATARELKTRLPTLSIAVLEKEQQLASHQSGRNSGVIHGGIYYKPGSLRAKLCVEGLKLMYDYCDKHNIPYKKVGKLIVATNEVEVERLEELMKRGLANGVPDLKMIDGSQIKEIEPHCKGLKAVHSPHTGIVDYGLVTRTYGSEFTKMGGKIFLGFNVSQILTASEGTSSNRDITKFPIRVLGSDRNQGLKAVHSPHTGIVDYGLVTRTYGSEFTEMGGKIFLGFNVSQIVTASEGTSSNRDITKFPIRVLGSDRNQGLKAVHSPHTGIVDYGLVTRTYGLEFTKMGGKIFLGFNVSQILTASEGTSSNRDITKFPIRVLGSDRNQVPDPRFPFLGVHFTPRMNGEIWLGPNALLAFKREGYRKLDINLKELYESLSHKGLQKFFYKYFSLSLNELWKSVVTSGQIKDLQKFVPDIKANDVISGPSGIRAQAMDVDGNLIEDFVFSGRGRILHCRNAPSPGATSSLAIAKILADKVVHNLRSL